ncbi:MAG: hypothetical protein M3325_05035 [Actinomycetota bacterium]|nr:hypothetical protein [Actinomycetota bacterium]
MVRGAEPDITQAAIDRFHQILGEQDIAEATRRLLMREQYAVGLQVQGRPLTQVLRPRLISGTDHAWVCSVGSLLAGALQRLVGYALDDGEVGNRVRETLALSPVETALAAMSPPTEGDSPHSRLDGFFTSDQLIFVEFNPDSPAGPLTQEALAEIFAATPAMQAFIGDYRVQATSARQRIVENLMHAWTTGGMPGDGPQVAIVECGESQFDWEFTMLQAELHRQGIPAVICSTDDLHYDSTQSSLYAHDADGHRQPITVVHRRALINDLLSRYGPALIDHPLTRAWSAGACVMANSFTSQLATKKAALTLFSDPRTSIPLSPQEATAARQHLPWTRLIRPGPTTYHEQEIDLLTFARSHRERLVLKPNDDYGGHGIVCGWQTTDEDWQKALAHAMHDPHVIQERITIPQALYPTWADGTLRTEAHYESTDPFLFASTTHGCICRLSPTALINISAGGSCVPVFQVAPQT